MIIDTVRNQSYKVSVAQWYELQLFLSKGKILIDYIPQNTTLALRTSNGAWNKVTIK